LELFPPAPADALAGWWFADVGGVDWREEVNLGVVPFKGLDLKKEKHITNPHVIAVCGMEDGAESRWLKAAERAEHGGDGWEKRRWWLSRENEFDGTRFFINLYYVIED